MKRYFKKAMIAATVVMLGAGSMSLAHANELENPVEGLKVAKVAPSSVLAEAKEEKTTAQKAMAAGKEIVKEVKIEDVKGLFNVAKAKAEKELQEYQAKHGTVSKARAFWIGFKHGFWETLKAGVKLLIKVGPKIIAAIA